MFDFLYKNNKSYQVLFLVFSEPPVFSLFAVHFVDEHGYEDEEDEDDHEKEDFLRKFAEMLKKLTKKYPNKTNPISVTNVKIVVQAIHSPKHR